MADNPDGDRPATTNTDYAALLASFGSQKFVDLRPAQAEALARILHH